MFLKIVTRPNKEDVIDFYECDNVVYMPLEVNEDNPEEETSISIKRDTKVLEMRFVKPSTQVYLMNNNGKTIERFQ